jgi:hypothetical protein
MTSTNVAAPVDTAPGAALAVRLSAEAMGGSYPASGGYTSGVTDNPAVDIDKERARIEQLEEHIEEAEQKARDLTEPRPTAEGGPRSTDPDKP